MNLLLDDLYSIAATAEPGLAAEPAPGYESGWRDARERIAGDISDYFGAGNVARNADDLFGLVPAKPAPGRILSVIEGRDPDVLDALFGFYARPAGPVADLTCNARRMWAGLDTAGVTFCDIDPAMAPDIVCDFGATPFADASLAAVVFDPPHLPAAAGSEKSDPGFAGRYGLKRTVAGDNINAVFPPFLAEAARILMPDGLAFCKLADFVHNHRYQWTLVDFVTAVRAVAGLTATDLIIKRDPCAGNLKSGRWEKNHHARRAHCWWVVVRKGKCEPKGNHPAASGVGRRAVS